MIPEEEKKIKKKLVVFSGAGISAESGIQTFRDSGGLWEKYDVNEVATPEGWAKDPGLVLKFYNERRMQLVGCEPNEAHIGLAELEKHFDVTIVTQNVDDLHERGGSTNVMHLHGELNSVRSTDDPTFTYKCPGQEINLGDNCELGSQLRPDIVWFGEGVPLIGEATKLFQKADYCLVVGTSLNVYPAAGLLEYFYGDKIYLIDPNSTPMSAKDYVTYINENATTGVKTVRDLLLKEIE